MLRMGPLWLLASELRGQREPDEGEDNEPTRMSVDGYAEDPTDPQSRYMRHSQFLSLVTAHHRRRASCPSSQDVRIGSVSSGARTTRTEHLVWRATNSATLPRRN